MTKFDDINSVVRDAQQISAGEHPRPSIGMSGIIALTTIASIVSILGVFGLFQLIIRPILQIPVISTDEIRIGTDHVVLIASFLFTVFTMLFVLFYMMKKLMASTEQYLDIYTKYISTLNRSSPLFQAMRGYNYSLEQIRSVSSSLIELIDLAPQEKSEITFLKHVLDSTQSIFERLTGDKCAVCIKIPDPDNSKRVRTLLRDSLSRLDRNYIDRDQNLAYYDLTSNTAFRDIVDPRKDDNSFIHNNLRMLAGDGNYQNANPNWAKHYNATAVVPIHPGNHDIRDSLVGFICVDNQRGGFERDVCEPILKIVSNMVCLYLVAFEPVFEDSEEGEAETLPEGGADERNQDEKTAG